jgi:hypothetical protein
MRRVNAVGLATLAALLITAAGFVYRYGAGPAFAAQPAATPPGPTTSPVAPPAATQPATSLPATSQAATQPSTQASPPAAAFERLKAMAGIWELEHGPVVTSEGMTEFKSVLRVTSGGKTVVQTDFPGAPRENVTVFHADGPDALMATHYCPLGSQPRMRCTRFDSPDRISFIFYDGTNVDPAHDRHCHNLMVTFMDEDHFQEDWTFYVNGQQDHIKTFNWKRIGYLPAKN